MIAHELLANTELLALGFSKYGWIGWIIIGGLAGWIASMIMGTNAQQGFFMNIVVGVIGGVIGGIILKFLWPTSGAGFFVTFLTALVGACILIWIVKLVTGRRV